MVEPGVWWLVACGAIGGGIWWVQRWLKPFLKAVQAERARELFRLQHERFEEALLAAAARTGKPRGLTWTGCTIAGEALLVRDRLTGELAALVPVIVQFEPIPGQEMEAVPAAREPRATTALFTFHRGDWTPHGQVIFNLTPQQVLTRGDGRFALLEH